MSRRPRFVFDTNVLVSALMVSRSKPRQAWDRARKVGVILASHGTLQELASVLHRPKLAAYIALSETTMFLTEFARAVELVAIGERVALVAIRAMTKFSS